MAAVNSLMAVTTLAAAMALSIDGTTILIGPAPGTAMVSSPGRIEIVDPSSRTCNVPPANGWAMWQSIATCWQLPFA